MLYSSLPCQAERSEVCVGEGCREATGRGPVPFIEANTRQISPLPIRTERGLRTGRDVAKRQGSVLCPIYPTYRTNGDPLFAPKAGAEGGKSEGLGGGEVC